MHGFCSNYFQVRCCSQLNTHSLETSEAVSDVHGAVEPRVHEGLYTIGNYKLFLCSHGKETNATTSKHSHGSNSPPEYQNLV